VASALRYDGAPRVLVTDGEQRCALAACRALAAAGCEVGVASAHGPAAAKWSRYCTERVRVPDPRRDPAGFAGDVRNTLARGHYDVVLAGGDASLLALSAHRDQLDPLVRLGLPPHEVLEACLDKAVLDAQARVAGFLQPATLRCSDIGAGRAAAAELGYPVIVKPRRSFSGRPATEHKPALVADDHGLAAAAAELGGPFLVQEFLRNAPVVSCAGVIADGRLLGFVTSRYARVWPPSRGSAACSETFRAPASLRDAIHRLVAALGWTGMFEIELLERRDGTPAVIDFNTRLYGTLALAVRAGCNLPAIWCRYLVQRDFVDAKAASGLRYRWEDGELFSLLRALARGERRTAGTIVRSPRDVVWAHYQPGDAGPLVARLLYLGRRGIETALSHTSTGGQP
jgi:predicted ATP-grasp superfamily ATP-dependent carboligase